ncbi:MAG: nucleoside hydrolase-like domain-containing protein [Cyclobacteriaceae bacterium]
MSMLTLLLSQCGQTEKAKPRVVISSDIGGTDPDDFQSMIHLLMYADLFRIEGLISSPYGPGRKKDFFSIINLYEDDLNQLKEHSPDFPDAEELRQICKQGEVLGAPFKGYRNPTEGSEWIIKCAKKAETEPLWILVWGGLEDLAQALYDAPEIKDNIKVYWIGGPNKKWSVNAYSYIASQHSDLWMIEANATYRGWFIDSESREDLKGDQFYKNYIEGHGKLGQNFVNHYEGNIKMGDTPSLAYLMNGDPENVSGQSWGGSFIRIKRSSKSVFHRNTTTADTVAAYEVIEWIFDGPEIKLSKDSACFTMKISNQVWSGYYLGEGKYGVRYSSKKPEICNYTTSSAIAQLDGLKGQFVSTIPWPGKASPDDYLLGDTWYGDRPEPQLFLGMQQGARTVSKHREAFLIDWAKRWEWIE